MSGETALLGDLASWPSNIVPGIGASPVTSPNVQLVASALVDTGDGTTGMGVSTAIATLNLDPGELTAAVMVGQSNIPAAMLSRDKLALAGVVSAGVGDVPTIAMSAMKGIFGSAAAATSTPNESLGVQVALSGSVVGIANTSDLPLGKRIPIESAPIVGVASVAAALGDTRGLAGGADGVSLAIAGLQGDAAMIAGSDGTSSADAGPFLLTRPLVALTVVGTSSADGTMDVVVGLSGASIGAGNASASAFDRIDEMGGSSAGVADASAFGDRQPREYEGRADGACDVLDVQLSVTRAINGRADGKSDVSVRHLNTYLGRPLILLGSRGG